MNVQKSKSQEENFVSQNYLTLIDNSSGSHLNFSINFCFLMIFFLSQIINITVADSPFKLSDIFHIFQILMTTPFLVYFALRFFPKIGLNKFFPIISITILCIFFISQSIFFVSGLFTISPFQSFYTTIWLGPLFEECWRFGLYIVSFDLLKIKIESKNSRKVISGIFACIIFICSHYWVSFSWPMENYLQGWGSIIIGGIFGVLLLLLTDNLILSFIFHSANNYFSFFIPLGTRFDTLFEILLGTSKIMIMVICLIMAIFIFFLKVGDDEKLEEE
ncbi:MAG: hypothetical protein EAX96_06325 [Candidatus Lokiarchaeota archaeon]|nr:hypothetical protein [Candidatus Lokiarchaeota archaeon]